MFNEILACLDGSSLAQTILPLAQGIAADAGATLTVLRVVGDADELAAAENALRECSRRYGAEVRVLLSRDPAAAIVGALDTKANAIAAMTTRGRTAWGEAIIGSVALQVVRGSRRPVILYRPDLTERNAPKRVGRFVLALDGSEFSERMIPFTAEMARSLAAGLTLVQALPLRCAIAGAQGQVKNDTLESSYLYRLCGKIKRKHGIDCEWEVLHGDAAQAICDYVKGMPETMLALSSHARAGLQRALLGGVAAACVRRAGVPVLIYWPNA